MFHLLTYLGKDPNFLLCFPRLFFLVREEQRLSQFYLVSLRIKHRNLHSHTGSSPDHSPPPAPSEIQVLNEEPEGTKL